MISYRALLAVLILCGLASTSASRPALAAEPTKKECVAANESGQDLRQNGKLREARAALAVCMAQRCPRPVREDCAQRLSEIEAALPTLLFVAKDADGNDLTDVRVSMDGQPLGASDGTAVAVDPGDHNFTFEKDGMPTVRNAIVVREGDKNRRILMVLESPRESAPQETATPPPGTRGPRPPSGLFGLSPSTERSLGIGVGAAGVAGVALGTIFGLMSKSTYDQGVKGCPPEDLTHCSRQGAADGQTAHSQAGVSTIAFIAGGALLAGGAVLFFATPSGNVTVGPSVAYGGGGLRVGGRF